MMSGGIQMFINEKLIHVCFEKECQIICIHSRRQVEGGRTREQYQSMVEKINRLIEDDLGSIVKR